MPIPVPDKLAPLDNLLPDEPLLMMGAGPVPIPARVAAANSIVINHLGDTMADVIEQVKAMSRYVFQTESRHILGVAGPGSAAMEMAVVNLVSPGDRVLSVCNGFFSRRLAEMAERTGGEVRRLEVPARETASPEAVERALLQHRPRVLTIVQGETSNTIFNRHLETITGLARSHDCLVIVDAVCTLSTMPLQMDDWGVDAVITGGQKGFLRFPGCRSWPSPTAPGKPSANAWIRFATGASTPNWPTSSGTRSPIITPLRSPASWRCTKRCD